jgi:methionine transaminase
MHLTSKLPSSGTTIFSVMSKLALEHGALNLGQGFPGFSIDPLLGALTLKYISKGHNQYAPMPGVVELRKAIAQKIRSCYGHAYDVNDEITVTAGATQAIYTTLTALVHEGDEVILFAPAYDSYAPGVELNGGIVVWAELEAPRYEINWELVKKLINHRTKAILINTPHNPTGTVLKESDLRQLEKIVSGTDIIIISDEVYEHMVFDGVRHESVARYPALRDKSVIVGSFGKTFHVTGWKMGYVAAPAFIMHEIRKVHQFNVFSCNTPVQYALSEYMEDPSRWSELPRFYQRKRNLFLEALQGSRFKAIPASGSYFQLLDYGEISEEKDTELAVRMTKEQKLTAIPVSVFYPNGSRGSMLRFCFAKEDDDLKRAGEILQKM